MSQILFYSFDASRATQKQRGRKSNKNREECMKKIAKQLCNGGLQGGDLLPIRR